MREPGSEPAPSQTRRAFLAGSAVGAAVPLLLRVPAVRAATTSTSDFGYPPPDKGVHLKRIVFPVVGFVSWVDTFGACRDGCTRHHEGQDLFGKKGQKLVAAVDGTIVSLRHSSTGNSLYIRSDSDGWYYAYLHINNDTPGTDDGSNHFSTAFAPGMATGVHVRSGQHVAYLGDSGNAETTSPHCHFEIRKPASSVWHSRAVNAKYSLRAARHTTSPSGSSSRSSSSGSSNAPSGQTAMRKGDGGGSVTALQRALNYGSGARLVADGSFGPRTELAVKRLQRWFRLTVDGVYGPRSQRVLQIACDSKRR